MKERLTTCPRDLDIGGEPEVLVWHKRRWVCRESVCALGTFTEQIGQIPARARATGRLHERAGRQVADGGHAVAQACRDHGLSWPVVQAAAYVAIDLCPTCRAAVRRALPGAQLVADAFHVVQLANRKLVALRRRLTWARRSRRGRTGDPEWDIRGLLIRNKEDLTGEQLNKITTHLGWMGTRGRHIHAAWTAKELLRDLLRLTCKHAGHPPTRSVISSARYTFQAWCADHAFLPEVAGLAETIDTWWDEIEAYIRTARHGTTRSGTEH